MRPAIPMQDVVKGLGATGAVAMFGYVFDGSWAQHNRAPLERFLPPCGRRQGFWLIGPRNVRVTDAGALDVYRQRFIEGLPQRPLADEAADARALYHVLAEIGGAELVGPSRDLDRGTFYGGGRSE